jgi:hypothetical protein
LHENADNGVYFIKSVSESLARILHEGFGIYGQAGKAGWTIARGFIAIAMDQGGSFKMRRQIAHKTK